MAAQGDVLKLFTSDSNGKLEYLLLKEKMH
jgi:hypothetical protein